MHQLSRIAYKGDFFANSVKRIAWNQVAGVVYEPLSEKDYFVNVLGYSENQYNTLKLAIENQHTQSGSTYDTPDFAHYQISLALRLAYATNNDLPITDIANIFVGEDISYLAGRLGDAVLADNNGTTSFKNDDYCADLDAENTYRIILEGYSSVDAISRYFSSFSISTNRATIFLNYLPYNVVRDKVFYVLVDIDLLTIINSFNQAGYYDSAEYYRNLLADEEYHFERIQEEYLDTYNFLMSLEDNLSNMGDY